MIYLKPFKKGNSRSAKVFVEDFSSGISTVFHKTLTPLNVATYSYNTDFKSGAIKEGAGVVRATYGEMQIANFNIDGVSPVALYYFKAYDQANERYLDYLLIYASDGNVYKNLLGSDDQFILVNDLSFGGKPNAVTYNYGGKDVIIFSHENVIKVYDGTTVLAITDAPAITSTCIHNERLFATEGGQKTTLWFSDDFNPLNWNVSLEDAGYVDLRDGRGSLLKVVSFGGYVYVFRNYGITRITAYGDQINFSVDGITSTSGKICKDSIAVCGDAIIYLACDGFYRFSGNSTTRILTRLDGLLNDMDNENAKGCYFNGNYFCTLNLKDESGNLFQALLRYDLTRGTFTLSKNLGVIDYAVLEGENQFKLLLICADNSAIGELSNKSEYYGATLEKSWHSGESDFGIKKEKRLTKLYLNTQTPVKVRVKCENGYRDLYFDGSEKRQFLPVGLRGQYFSFCIECSNNTCLVSYLCAEFEYEG